jgi:hypothetical protein
MLRHVVVVVAVALTAVLSAACIQVPNLLAPQNPVDFCVEQAKSYCALQFRCCTAAERTSDALGVFHGPSVSRWAPSNEDECAGLVADICRGNIEEQNESLREERVKYDADEAASCLDELHQAVDDCDIKDFFKKDGSYMSTLVSSGQPGIFGGACEDAVKGDVDDGDTCFAQYECKRGACDFSASGNDDLKGDCTGDQRAPNPFADFSGVHIEVCDGLEDNSEENQ